MRNDTKLIFSGLFLILFLAVSVSAYDVCIDNTAPSAPASLVIKDSPYDADGIVVLSWKASTDTPSCGKVAYYNIYRASNSSEFSKIAESTGLTYTDSGLTKGFTYYYKITAVDSVEISPHEGAASQTKSTTIGTAPAQGGGSNGGSSGGSSSGGSSGGSSYIPTAKTTNLTNTTEGNSTAPSNSTSQGEEENLSISENLAGSEENATTPSNSTGKKNWLTGFAIGDLFAGDANPIVGIIVMLLIAGLGIWLFFLLNRKKKKKGKKHKR